MNNRLMIVVALSFVLAGCGQQGNQTGQMSSEIKTQTAAATTLKNQGHIDEGMEQLRESDIVGAIKSFDEAIKQNPRDPHGYLVLGQTYMRLKEYDRAIDTLSAASQVAPQEGEVYYLLAVSYGLTGNSDLAVENAEKSVQIFQDQKNEEKFVRSVALLKGLSEGK